MGAGENDDSGLHGTSFAAAAYYHPFILERGEAGAPVDVVERRTRASARESPRGGGATRPERCAWLGRGVRRGIYNPNGGLRTASASPVGAKPLLVAESASAAALLHATSSEALQQRLELRDLAVEG